MIDILDIVDIIDIVKIVDIVGIIDTVDIFSNLERCQAIEAISKTLITHRLSIMGLRDASASKNDANGDYIDDDQRMKLFQKLTFPFSTL